MEITTIRFKFKHQNNVRIVETSSVNGFKECLKLAIGELGWSNPSIVWFVEKN